MASDYTEIDRVISLLQKKRIGGGSPPEMLNGHLVLFRTIRGFRTALELTPGGGKWAVDWKGKPHVGGRVLVGPPSLVGQNIRDVDPSIWEKISGSGIKATFPPASAEGVAALKNSVKNALPQTDTRIPVIEEEKDQAKLVQLARSAGFTDEEIKAALGGKVFENEAGGSAPTPPKKEEGGKVTPLRPSKTEDNVVPLRPKDKKDKQEDNVVPLRPNKTEDDKVTPIRPAAEKPETPTQGKMTADGSFAPLIEALTDPDLGDDAESREKAASKVEEAAKGLNEEFLRRQIQALADGLRSGDYGIPEVLGEIGNFAQHRRASMIASLTEESMDKLSDKAAAKKVVAEVKAHAAAASATTPAQIEANARYYAEALLSLSKQIKNPEVSRQLIVLSRKIKSGRIGGNSVVLRLLAILRLILAFIPG